MLVVLFSPAQKNYDKIIAVELSDYFQILPFGKTLAELVAFYNNDTNYMPDSIVVGTDTSHLYIRGFHKTYNPFSFTPKRGNIICFRETENVIKYHITALLDTTLLSRELVEKEFNLLHKQFRKLFPDIDYDKSRKKDEYPYEFNYYSGNYSWYLELGWSYAVYPYYTGYYLIFSINMYKEKDKTQKK